MHRRVVLLAPLSLLIARAACAHSFRLGSIEIGHPWAKPSATDAAAMFLALSNTGSKADRLLGGETPAAAEVLLRDRGGAPMEYLDLLPRRPVALRPGGRYIALRGLKAPLAIDDNFPMILRFAEAGSITVTVTVEDAPEE